RLRALPSFPTRRSSDLVAFGGAGVRDSLFASVVLGSLASAISFARYFPNRVEDSDKGKRTPVTILGFRGARRLFLVLPLLPVPLDRKSTRLNSSHVSIS